MTPKQLRKRQIKVQASPQKKISSIKSFSRRDTNKIKETKEAHPNDVFDSFFDFEEDMSGMKSASEQFVYESNRDDKKNDNDTEEGYTIMKEISTEGAVIMSSNLFTQN